MVGEDAKKNGAMTLDGLLKQTGYRLETGWIYDDFQFDIENTLDSLKKHGWIIIGTPLERGRCAVALVGRLDPEEEAMIQDLTLEDLPRFYRSIDTVWVGESSWGHYYDTVNIMERGGWTLITSPVQIQDTIVALLIRPRKDEDK